MASKNMVILGLLVLIGILLHLTHFWAKMQLQEFIGKESITGAEGMIMTFKCWWVYAIYIVWFIILWFHLTHGFWSAFQSMGWNNDKWLRRLQWIGYIYATILVVLFIAVATKAFLVANGCIG